MWKKKALNQTFKKKFVRQSNAQKIDKNVIGSKIGSKIGSWLKAVFLMAIHCIRRRLIVSIFLAKHIFWRIYLWFEFFSKSFQRQHFSAIDILVQNCNDHLRIATTCLQRPLFWSPIWDFNYIHDLWTMTTCQQQPLFLGRKGGRCTQ